MSDWKNVQYKDGKFRSGEGGGGGTNNLRAVQFADPYNIKFKDIQHRGANTFVPENTLLAFLVSKRLGFNYVETDATMTADNVPVLLHDLTVYRTTGSNLGNIHDLTYNQIKDLYANNGTWDTIYYKKSQDSTNPLVKIPTLDEFIRLCKTVGLHPYIEIGWSSSDTSGWVQTKAQTKIMYDIVKKYDMERNVTWISFHKEYLEYIIDFDKSARIGLIASSIDNTLISNATSLKTGINEVFIDLNIYAVTQQFCDDCMDEDIGVEVWTVDSISTIKNLPDYVTGVTSNTIHASRVWTNELYNYGGLPSVAEAIYDYTPSFPAWIESGGKFHFTYLGNGLVRCLFEFKILKNSSTPSSGTVYIDMPNLPKQFFPVWYQSYPIPWYNTNSGEKTGICRCGLSKRYENNSSNSCKFVISEFGEIPTGGISLRGNMIYSVDT